MPDSRIDDFDYDYWHKVVGLTIYEAAFWMQIGSDPRGHQARYEQDNEYCANFEEHPYGATAVRDVCQILIDAIHAGLIKTLGEVVHSNRDVDAKNTRIRKSDWLTWCHKNGYSDTTKLFARKIVEPQKPKPIDGLAKSDWKEQARTIADELFDSDTNQGCRDSLDNYSKRVMERLHGIITNKNTVKREALQGGKWWATKAK
jgi:hypothetical protein